MQRRNLEHTESRDPQGVLLGPALDRPRRATSELTYTLDRPQPDVSVKQEGARQALSISHSASIGSNGLSYLRTVPFRQPKIFRGFDST